MKCRRCGKKVSGDAKPPSDTAPQDLCGCEKRDPVYEARDRNVGKMVDDTEPDVNETQNRDVGQMSDGETEESNDGDS